MLLKARPLFDNLGDSELFVTPGSWNPLMQAVERDVNVLLIGPRGVGKTSLLRQAQKTLREHKERVAFVDANALEDVLMLTTRIRDALVGQPAPISQLAGAAAETVSRDPAPIAGASRLLAGMLREIAATEPTTVLLDASSSGKALYELFGRMRDILWQQEHRWAVAIDDTDRATALKPPADAFFDVLVRLSPWSTNDLIELLMRRREKGEALSDELAIGAAAAAKGSPREALRALSDALVRERDPAEQLEERGRLLDEASEVGRAPAMLMAELLDRGAASPSDEDLQATLGVTRSRLTQLFRKLLDANLAVADVERPDGPGRPRTVYRPALDR